MVLVVVSQQTLCSVIKLLFMCWLQIICHFRYGLKADDQILAEERHIPL